MAGSRGLHFDVLPGASDHTMAMNPDLYAPKKKEPKTKSEKTQAQVELKMAEQQLFANTFETVWRRNSGGIPIINAKDYHGEAMVLVKEFHFNPATDSRADYFIKIERLNDRGEIEVSKWIIELQGGIYLESGGGHRSISGYLRDCVRNNDATLLDYRVLLIPTGLATDTYVKRLLDGML